MEKCHCSRRDYSKFLILSLSLRENLSTCFTDSFYVTSIVSLLTVVSNIDLYVVKQLFGLSYLDRFP